MKKLLYFAYGSNLLPQRLFDRVGKCPIAGTHVLQNYALTFDCGGFANIQPEEGSVVEGVLYEMTPEQFKRLDTFEGFYVREFFDLPEGALGVVYIGSADVVSWHRRMRTLPHLAYINIVLDGMKLHNLITSYNKTVILKNNLFKLSKGSKHKLIPV